MKIKTAELIGRQLNAAVALAEGAKGLRLHTYRSIDPLPQVWVADFEHDWVEVLDLDYSTNWGLGGEIVQQKRIDLQAKINAGSDYDEWLATISIGAKQRRRYGPTPLIAAMRCYVASKFGDEVELPDGLEN